MTLFLKRHVLSIATFIFVFTILSFIQVKLEKPMLLAERFIEHAGWIEIILVSIYAAFIVSKMKDTAKAPIWRLRIWILFSIVFFLQLILGLLGIEQCLMKGIKHLHLPIPALIVAGPIYRAEIGFMFIFFLSTILLSGPTWCSHLCYFGAIDAWLSKGKKSKNSISNKWHWKIGILAFVIGMAIFFRIFQIAVIYAILLSVIFGLLGIAVMLFLSRKHKQMWHCVMFCPIGTIVSMLKFASPFRMSIANNCTQCMKCLPSCKYDALTAQDIKQGKPGLTCTYCGDCLNSCSSVSIQYHFLGSSGKNARYLFLFLSVSLHAISLALARI